MSRPMRSKVQASIEALGYLPNISARSLPTIVDGLTFSPIAVTQSALGEVLPAVPLVLLGEHLMASQRSRVAVDNVAASAQAVGHLLAVGRRRIAAIGAKRGSTAATAELRLACYRRALTEVGVEIDPDLEVATGDFTRAAGSAAAETLLSSGVAFDALFCFNDLLALGAIEVLQRRGRSVPADVAVVGFDDIEEGRHSSPDLTTVAVDLTVLADAAVDTLVRRLDDPSTPEGSSIVVPHRLVVRGSTVPRTTSGPADVLRPGWAPRPGSRRSG